MTTTTSQVPVELRDRLAEHARQQGTTLAGAPATSLDAADTLAFWERVRSTMGTPQARAWQAAEAERFAPSLKDGLEPEDWSDIL